MGLPPKVVPCVPGVSAAANSGLAARAPIGRPPARPFAIVTASGSTPKFCMPNHSPVRPMPVCTSSTIMSAP